MEIARPAAIAIHVEAHKVAVGVEENHDLAVSNRRGSSKSAAPVMADALCYFVPPEEFSVGPVKTHRQQHVFVRIDAGQKDPVFEDYRCGG